MENHLINADPITQVDSYKHMTPLIITILLSTYALIQIPSKDSLTHLVLEITQIISGLIGLIISLVTFWFSIIKPKFFGKVRKRNK